VAEEKEGPDTGGKAQAQFARTAALDLTPPDKSERARRPLHG
jgi:hypothetical protein